MTIKDLLAKYANKEQDAIQTIRFLTAFINPKYAVDILAMINQITRLEQGDMDLEDFIAMYELKND